MTSERVRENVYSASGEALESERSTPLLPDTPSDHDVLDYKDYRDALISVIEGFTTETTLVAGVFGDWGSGKTTLLNLVRDGLKQRNVEYIWVNVWKYANEEDVWAAFLQALLLKVKEEMPWYKRLLFNLGLIRRRINWTEVAKSAFSILVRIAIVVIPLYFASSKLISSDQSAQSIAETVAAGAGTLLSGVLGWYLLLKPYLQEIRKRVSIDLTKLIEASPLRERVSVLEQLQTFFEDMIIALVGEKGRLVIFVDDLDRCPPERIVQVLDALKLFLDTSNCVYMIGLDRGIIEQAVEAKFDGYDDKEAEAQEYLEKIIGLPFDLPPLSREQMGALVKGFDIVLPGAGLSAQVFALGQEPNPRKVKRTINIFLVLWELAQRRGGLRDTIKPVRLAKIVVIQHSYRALYSVVTATPEALGELELHFRQAETPRETEEVLSESETTAAGDNRIDATQPALPDYLQPFTNNEDLKRLLTLHSGQHDEIWDSNFVVWHDDEYHPLPEEEIRPYIELTYTITREQLDLRRADLRGANLSGRSMSGYDLREADLSRADLSEIDLSEADLAGASLREARGLFANLQAANLKQANFRKGRLVRS